MKTNQILDNSMRHMANLGIHPTTDIPFILFTYSPSLLHTHSQLKIFLTYKFDDNSTWIAKSGSLENMLLYLLQTSRMLF